MTFCLPPKSVIKSRDPCAMKYPPFSLMHQNKTPSHGNILVDEDKDEAEVEDERESDEKEDGDAGTVDIMDVGRYSG